MRDNFDVKENMEKDGMVSKFAFETKYGFKLCESKRDFGLGRYVLDLTMDAIRASRRTIIILSE